MNTEDLDEVTALDAEAFGISRINVIRALFEMAKQYAWVNSLDGKNIDGFILGRSGNNFEQMGPIVAHDSNAAISLVEAATSLAEGKAIGLDMYGHSGWLEWLQNNGFSKQRTFTRMVRGEDVTPENIDHLFAISGPEMG
jgi:hypothetical protein